jgi:hypothetical protein
MCCDDAVEKHGFTHVASRKPRFNGFDLIDVFPSATRFRTSLLGELVQRGENSVNANSQVSTSLANTTWSAGARLFYRIKALQ